MSQRHEGTSRRGALRSAAVGAGALAAWSGGGTAPAFAAGRTRGAARIVSRRSGPFEVMALLDAHGAFPGRQQDQFPAATAEDWEEAERIDPAAFGPDDTWQLDFRCYAIRSPGGRITLVDTGVGPVGSPASGWAPVPGMLPEVLAAAGIERCDVEAVVLTHLHEDHFGWAVGADGAPMFPDAWHLVQSRETAALAPEDAARSYVVEPLRRAGLLREIDGGARLLHGGHRRHGRHGTVTAVPTPGHTPGHQSVLVDGGPRRILVTGDVLVHAVQLAAPSVAYRAEADHVTARRSREQALADARRDGTLLATSHLNHPFARAACAGRER